MPQARFDVDTLFFEAIAIDDAAARRAFIAQAAGGTPQLRRQLEKLVAAHFEAGEFLQHPVPGDDAARAAADDPAMTAMAPEIPHARIGPYRIRELLGEGGMGSVYVAEQEQPIRRKVALKVIKPGMDSREIIARFEAERQALTLMDHPHIARVLDAGTTEPGRPYFIMELVKGLPITEHCDAHRLPIRERLELFLQVCQAVQHAHQKAIIHRDLKPSNVLVAMLDTTPQVKVIDFGVAKALGSKLTEGTLYTGFSQVIGTPLYMSPEQAGQSSLDIDTRSDVYSLGVLLYELLTGETPLLREDLKQSSLDEIRRLIREVEPPLPSVRVGTAPAAALSTISEKRRIEPRQLTGKLRGELDWIVMKALEKDRQRRYESASALAADVERYLKDEPVEACPPSVAYRMRKFVRRRAAALATVLVIALALVIGTGISLWQAAEARQARAAAVQEREDAEHNLELARVAIDKMVLRLRDDSLPPAPQFDGVRRAVLSEAIQLYEQLLAQKGQSPSVRFSLANAWRRIGEVKLDRGEVEESERAYDTSFRLLEQLVADYPKEPAYIAELAEANRWQAGSLYYRGAMGSSDKARAVTALRKALALRELLEKLEPDHWEHRRDRWAVQLELEKWQGRKNDLDWLRRRLETTRQLLAEHPDDIGCLWMVIDAQRDLTHSFLWHQRGEAEEIRCLVDETVQLVQRGLDRGAPERAWRNLLGGVLLVRGIYLESQGAVSEAEASMRQSISVMDDLSRRFLLDRVNEGMRADGRIFLGELLQTQERLTEAAEVYQAAFDSMPADGWRQRGKAFFHLMNVRMQQGRADAVASSLKDYIDATRRDKTDSANETDAWRASLVTAELMRREAAGKADLSINDLWDPLQIRAWKNEESARVELLDCINQPATKDRSFFPLTRLALGRHTAELLSRNRSSDPKQDAFEHNRLAWRLITSRDHQMWDAALAVKLASKAVKLDPSLTAAWRILGVSQYRAGNDAAAIEGLNKSVEMRSDGFGYDFFFLAMAHGHAGNTKEALAWHDKAVAWMEAHKSEQAELLPLRAEAAELLGIDPKPPAPELDTAPRENKPGD